MALNFAKNNSLSAVTELPASVSGGGFNLISTQTASSSATISFTSGIDSTYDEYVFKFYDIHGSGTSSNNFTFQTSTNGGSSYGVTLTSTFFYAYHGESAGDSGLTYNTTPDLAQSTNFQRLCTTNGTNNDSSASGTLQLFSPSSSTFVKHFMSDATEELSNYNQHSYVAGYFNTTSAINAVQFKMSSSNIDSGVIKLYGIS
tara:strand:- start:623 stop:1228 length:606 start_codon:yes stop_codon:yes gene_type:complete